MPGSGTAPQAYMCAGFMGWLAPHWRHFVALQLACAPVVLLYFGCSAVESARWLVQRGRLQGAADALNCMAAGGPACRSLRQCRCEDKDKDKDKDKTRAGIIFTEDSLSRIERASGNDKKLSLLFTDSILLKSAIVLALLYMTTDSIQKGYLLQISVTKEGDPIFDLIIYGAARLLVAFPMLIGVQVLATLSRRGMAATALLIIAALYSAALANWYFEWIPQRSVVQLGCMLAAATAANILWVAMAHLKVELFPTSMRNTAVALCTLLEPVCGLLMPQMIYVQSHLGWHWAVLAPLTFLCLLCAVLACTVLQETAGRPLPDTVMQAESAQ